MILHSRHIQVLYRMTCSDPISAWFTGLHPTCSVPVDDDPNYQRIWIPLSTKRHWLSLSLCSTLRITNQWNPSGWFTLPLWRFLPKEQSRSPPHWYQAFPDQAGHVCSSLEHTNWNGLPLVVFPLRVGLEVLQKSWYTWIYGNVTMPTSHQMARLLICHFTTWKNII